MKPLIALALAAGLLAPTPPALAAYESIRGGCFLDRTPSGGVMGDVSFTYDGADAPVFATIHCKVQVDDVDVPGAEHAYAGFGVQYGADPVAFTVGPGDSWSLCRKYDLGTSTGTWDCIPDTARPDPLPPEFGDALHAVACLVRGTLGLDCP